MADDAFTPRTTVDDSQFQGIINVHTTKRVVSVQTPLPDVGTAVDAKWGQFTNHTIIARGSTPLGNNFKEIWIQHLAEPASFEEQDAYNWAKTGSDMMSRFYVMKRADYAAIGYAATVPAAGTADTAFPLYAFATESVSKIGSDPNSIYVAVERIYILSPKIEKFPDDELEAEVTRITEVVPRNTVSSSNAAGVTVEVVPQSEHHDLKVTSTLAGDYSSSRKLKTVPSDANYSFPALLRGAKLVVAWAWADSQEAAPAYDEAWYIKYDRVKPMGGPYETRIHRFLTSEPDSLQSRFPLQKIVAADDSIGIARAWANASNRGNSAHADARQLDVPEVIHGEIKLEGGESISVGQSTNTLPATPGYEEFVGSGSLIIGNTPRRTRFGLYLVEIAELNCTGVYNGVHVPFGTQISPGVPLPDMGATYPVYDNTVVTKPSGSVSSDNRTLSGITSPGAVVKAYYGTQEIGRSVANTSGQYSLALDTVFTDPTTLTIRAFLEGSVSAPSTVATNDLAPGRPSGTISADGSTVQGVAEPGATVTILRDAVAQVETLTLSTGQGQIERLTVAGEITGDGDFEMVITWPGMTGSPKTITAAGVTFDDDATVAAKAAAAAMLDADVAAFLTVTSDGPYVLATAIAAADNEPTANLSIDNDTCTGLTPVTTSTTTQEGSSGTITSDGTAIAKVTSGIAAIPELSVPFQVVTGDDMTDVAAKAAAALALSAANDDYIPGSSTNNLSVTAREVAPNDPALAIELTAGTCGGLPISGASTNTTPGGTAVSVVANSNGDYFHSFGTPLSPGDVIEVTASDAGGESAPLMLEMSATPPTLATAIFADSDTITGTGTPNGATVRAYVDGVDIGDTTISAGAFSLNTDYKLVRGETVEVAVMATGNEDVRSASIFLTAADLDLLVPLPELVTGAFVGDVPAGASQIRVRNIDTLAETTATIHTNGTFSFSTAGQPAGQGFDFYARYSTGDSDTARVFVPTVPKGLPLFQLSLGPVRNTWVPGSTLDAQLGYTVDLPWCYKMEASFPVWIDGMDVVISFPGSSVADITITNFPEDGWQYQVSPPLFSTIYHPFGRPDFARRGSALIPLDTSGAVPMPYPLVKVTLLYPDGDVVAVTFDRSTYQNWYFKDGGWNYQWFTPDYRKDQWEDYYANSYPS